MSIDDEKFNVKTFQISEKGDSITCVICGMTSYHPGDIKNEYCGNCHQYHEFLGKGYSMSPTDGMDKIEDKLYDEFVKEVLDLDPKMCFISDGSSLYDFPPEIDEIFETVWDRYKIKLNKEDDLSVLNTLKRIKIKSIWS